MTAKELLTCAVLLVVLGPAVWGLLAASDRWLSRRGPRVLRMVHYRLAVQGRRAAAVRGRQAGARFWLIRPAPKARPKRPA